MKYSLEDNSNDRRYFTIIPNYILNHSSAIDQALYLQMKRAAGETGTCFMTEETMCKKLKIGIKKFKKSLDYLLSHGWIEFVGMTPGKTRPIKTYKVNDIWKLNTDFYNEKEIPPKSTVSKNTSQKEINTSQKSNIRKTNKKNNNNKKKNIIKRKRKYSSIKEITEEDLIEIANRYKVSVGFVSLQLEKLKNYCSSSGRRYKNYKSALRNFVLGDLQRRAERQYPDDNKRGIDARNVE